MQRERRRDPYPWTWEPAVLAIACVVLTLAVGVQLGRGLANLLAGAGWTWPDGQTSMGFSSPLAGSFWTSLPGVIGGDSDAGLATPIPDGTAIPLLVWICLAVVEVTLTVSLVAVIAFVLKRWGPGRMRGMASRAEAESLLGVSRLRKVADVVRPDLYGEHAGTNELVHHGAGSQPTVPAMPYQESSPWLLSRLTRRSR